MEGPDLAVGEVSGSGSSYCDSGGWTHRTAQARRAGGFPDCLYEKGALVELVLHGDAFEVTPATDATLSLPLETLVETQQAW